MGRYQKRLWRSGMAGIDVPRRDLAGGAYLAYIPDPLVGRAFAFDGDVTADVEDAAIAIARLDARATTLTNTEALARLLLRAEAVASSRIEGLSVSPQRLLRVSADLDAGVHVNDPTAVEVLANVEAMSYALTGSDTSITPGRILEIHRRLLQTSRAAVHAGVVRAEQNWIGGSDYNPLSAAFVPPPPGEVERLLIDLCEFCNGDSLPAVAQAAIAHAQFETIHPFADGNGRTGRALIYMVLRKRGLALRTIPPISLVLATRAKEYVSRLDGTRSSDPASSDKARAALGRWIGFFAAACTRAVADAEAFEERVDQIQATWRERIPSTRADAGIHALIDRLPEAPIITANGAAALIGKTFPTANNAIAALVDAKILFPTTKGSRNRTFEAREIIDAFTSLERQLASPQADTRVSKPERRVPSSPRRRT